MLRQYGAVKKNCHCSKIHGIEKGHIYQHFFALSVTFIMPLHISVCTSTMYFQILYVYHYIVVYIAWLWYYAIYYMQEKKQIHTFGLQWTCSFYKVFRTSTNSHSALYANNTVIYHPRIHLGFFYLL